MILENKQWSSIIALYKGKLLLLREFRMAVNDYVYNLVAGRIEPGETLKTVFIVNI